MSMNENEDIIIEERVVLSKYEGESPVPENEIERIIIINGEIIEIQKIENGEVVSTETVKEE